MSSKDKKKYGGKKLFDVEFNRESMLKLIEQEIEKIDPKEMNDKNMMGAINSGIANVFGSVLSMALPIVSESMKHNIDGYRIIIECMDKVEHGLDMVVADNGVIINTKIKRKVEF
jgi:hypothetical protein